TKFNGFIAEEYIDGVLYHIDTCVSQGKTTFMQICQYSCPNAELLQGKVLGSLPLLESNEVYKKLRQFAQQVLDCLKIDNMVNHMEVFIANDEVCFLEIAARPPGGLISKMHEMNTGVNLVDQAFLLQAGFTPDCSLKQT